MANVQKIHLRVDLDAPIIPGEGAAGLRLGHTVSDFADNDGTEFAIEQTEPTIPELEPRTFLRTESISVWTANEVITQTGVHGNYGGALYDRIRIGDMVERVVSEFGPVGEDETDNLVAAYLPGMCFELPAGDWLDRIRDSGICEMDVFSSKCDHCGSEQRNRPNPARCQGCGLIVFEEFDL